MSFQKEICPKRKCGYIESCVSFFSQDFIISSVAFLNDVIVTRSVKSRISSRYVSVPKPVPGIIRQFVERTGKLTTITVS